MAPAALTQRTSRRESAEKTKAEIIKAAIEEFSEHGFSGGRIEHIAERTRTSKRMIYYHFGGKEGVYAAALKQFYSSQRVSERELSLDSLPATDAMSALVGFIFDYHIQHAEHLRLVIGENIARGRHITKMRDLKTINSSIKDRAQAIYERGVKEGSMRSGLIPIDIYSLITSMAFFTVSNRYTFSFNFDYDMKSKKALAHRREVIIDCVQRFLAA